MTTNALAREAGARLRLEHVVRAYGDVAHHPADPQAMIP